MTFSEKAKSLKDKSHLTLSEIAAACNVSESMVSRYINGQTIPPEDVARKIIDFLSAAIPKDTTMDNRQMLLYMIRDVYEARLADMQDTVDELKGQHQLKEALLREQLQRAVREKWLFFALFAIVVVAAFTMTCIDIFNSDVGWLRR